MADALSIAAASMSFDMVKLASLSHNLANAGTTGYRREVVYGRPFSEWMALGDPSRPLPVQQPQAVTTVDPTPGTLRSTGAPLDVALQGEGWFELMAPEGPVYTRQGNLQIDARGRLVSHHGLPVLGTDGEITLGAGAVRIDEQGRVFEEARLAGRLRVVGFARDTALEVIGGGLVRAPGPGEPLDQPKLRQGFLENSNVTSVNEMVRLIETMRHFEANQKLIQSFDDTLGRAIRTLGEF